MKLSIKKTAMAVAVAGILGLSACNDSSNETSTASLIEKTTSGVITGFGSVFVNGVEYETDNAQFIVDGVVGDESLLKLGMVVSLAGTAAEDGTGDALSIEFNNDVKGVVINTDLSAEGIGTLNIMGIAVKIDLDTVFESKDAEILSLTDIVAGNIIEVSGHSSGDGEVWATRIEVKSAVKEANKEMEVKGTISSWDETLKTFMIGSMLVNYSGAELDGDFALADDVFVEVKSSDGLDAEGVLIASKIELEDGGRKALDFDENDDEVELEGVITNVVSATEIEVNGHTILITDTTNFAHGSAAVIAEGMKIKIRGSIDVDGNLVADKLIFKPSGDLRLAGYITETDIIANTFNVFGVTFTLNNTTMVKDDRDEESMDESERNITHNFGVDNLIVGDWVKVKAYLRDGALIATKMKRKTVEDDRMEKLIGILSLDPTTSAFSIAGIQVDLTGANITAADGDKVELKGNIENGVFVAQEAEAKEKNNRYVSGNGKNEKDLDDEEHKRRGHEGKDDDSKESSHDDSKESSHEDDASETGENHEAQESNHESESHDNENTAS